MDNKIITESWAKVWAIKDVAGPLFYKNLFEAGPELPNTLFKGVDMTQQPVKLLNMINIAVGMLDKPEELLAALRNLGEGHAAYGCEEEHYPIVGSALIKTLSQGLGDAFTPEVEAAWTALYGTIQTAMLEGAATERGQELAAKYKARVAAAAQ